MASASFILPPRLHPHRHCDNGAYPDSAFYGEATAALNHVVAFRRKPLFEKTVPLTATGGTSGVAWRWYCRTGYGAKRVAILALMALDDRVVAVDPYIEVIMTKVGGAALDTIAFHYGASDVASVDDPDSIVPFIRFVDVEAATEYTGTVEFFDNVRVVSLAVYEEEVRTVDDSNAYFSEYRPAAGSPVMDNRIGQQLEAVSNMLRYNGGLRLDWMRDDGTARTRTSATPINLTDNTTGSPPTAASPGETWNTQYRRTEGKVTVPVKMAVWGSVAGGGAGTVRYRDSGGTDAVTVTINNGTAQWFTGTGALTASASKKYDLYFDSDGVNQVNVYAVSIFEVS